MNNNALTFRTPFFGSTHHMSSRSSARGPYVIAIAAFALAIIACFFPLFGQSDAPVIGGGGGPRTLFSIYSNESQQVLPLGAWTGVTFNNDLLSSSAFVHSDSSDQILIATTGIYWVYFSIQAQVVRPDDVLSPVCKGCNLRYSIRATQQRNNNILEVPGSQAYSSGLSFLLTKEFLIDASEGDIFRFEFKSLCPDLTVYPYPVVASPTMPADESPVSASLMMFS